MKVCAFIFQLSAVMTPAMAVTMVRAAAVIIAPGAGSVKKVTAHNSSGKEHAS